MGAPTSVEAYLAGLPDDRREALDAIRAVILKNLGKGFEEGIQYGMIGYYVPHSVYPAGYHCDPKQPLPYASVASQKNHMAIYLFCIYCSPEDQETFVREWKATGKKLDMGKSCVRFKRLEDVPLDVVGRAIRRATAKKFIAHYESSLGSSRKKVTKKKAAPKKKAVTKKAASKKTVTRTTASKKVSKKKVSKKTTKKR